MKTLTLDGQSWMRAKEIDDGPMYTQVTLKLKAPHQKAWLVDRRDALIRFALQRAGSQVFKESLCISFVTVFGFVIFMHNALTCINNHIFTKRF